MNEYKFKMTPNELYFVPLGGCGVFGSNISLYGYNDQWIMVDCGMGFADDTMPGIDILYPVIDFATGLGDKLLAVVLTHAHEDHIGALGYHWRKLKKPMYATKFTAELIKRKGIEHHWDNRARLHEVPLGGHIDIGGFSIDFISMAHSIPESNLLAIEAVGFGTVLHTGDWKIDAAPMEGNITDEAALRRLGDKGVIAVMGDSTNAMVEGHSTSEKTVQDTLIKLVGEFDKGIAITCFAASVARFHSVYEAAKRHGRQVCLIGRSMMKIDEVARESGYLKGIPEFLNRDTVGRTPKHKLVYLCTGSQGEPRSAMTQIAGGNHPAVQLSDGDAAIFSARVIPGNERSIDRVKNNLMEAGVRVVTRSDAVVHASGHPYREELKQFYAWVRPQIAIPVHGERMQLEKHAQLASDCGVPETLIPQNGKVVKITRQCAEIVGEVTFGILAVEGNRVIPLEHNAIQMRKRIMFNGSAVVTLVVDSHGDLLAAPKLTAMGLLDEESDVDNAILDEVMDLLAEKIRNLPKGVRQNDEQLGELSRIAVRKFFQERFDRKPQTRVHLIRV
jgi:ribonuclease J